MKSPRTIKEVQRLTGCLAALDRFLSRSGDKCRYFFQTIKKKAMFEWTEEAEEALVQLKSHLHTFPQLVSPLKNEKLIIYLAISEHSLSVVLLAERDSHQVPVFFNQPFTSQHRAEVPLIEKFGLAFYMASKKLRSYFLAYSIVVYTDQPLKKPFTTLEANGRMLKWALIMSGFDITFEPRKAIKGQSFTDFLAEMTRPNLQPARDQTWKVFFDGSATATGCGAGVIFQSPEGNKFEYALRFQYQASNNEVEYEALLAGLIMCKVAEAKKVDVSSESLLVVGQVNGDFEAREPAMMKYLKIVKEEAKGLDHFTLQQAPRSSNHQADSLSKLASSASCDTPRLVLWEVKERRSIDAEPIQIIDKSSTWMDEIISYLRDGLLSADPKERWLMKKRAAWFEMKQGELLKKAFVKLYMNFVTPEKGHDVLNDLHQGQCGSHIGGRALAEKVAHLGYYWPILKSDAMKMVKKCDKCQIFATLIHRPASGIAHCFASVGRPQDNGQVEAHNKLISNGIKRKLEKVGGLWADELVNVLWSIRTTVKSSIGKTPFFLVYSVEVVLPIEMYEPTLRVMLYDEAANWEAMRTALDFLPEARSNATLRHKIYRLRMTRAYNRRVLKRPLKMGDLVLRKMEVVGRANEDGKLTPNWEGSYRISEEVRDGTYRLKAMNGRLIPRTWNSDNLKKYYV
ncbi:uncharacterized protein LOC110725012 [Chenopodium quinoa]|uniref:uncharacterized protein LOC110725012 n=1 Tax=Chenopodium quinoa TaxID=63459 RepID=UPI000B76E2D4|nr:uncharacterized protein LOC110725012 [Chenopodium quinoa]